MGEKGWSLGRGMREPFGVTEMLLASFEVADAQVCTTVKLHLPLKICAFYYVSIISQKKKKDKSLTNKLP